MNASFHYLNLMFQSKSKRKKKKAKKQHFSKARSEKRQLMSIKYGQNSFPKVCFDKTTISS